MSQTLQAPSALNIKHLTQRWVWWPFGAALFLLVELAYKIGYLCRRPDFVSSEGVIKLSSRSFKSCAYCRESRIVLQDGNVVSSGDRVFVLHLGNFALHRLVKRGGTWECVIRREFQSLAPFLKEREEKAIIGTTILRHVGTRFGGKLDELPESVWRTVDTFYSRWCLLYFFAGAARAKKKPRPVARISFALPDFCRRFGF